MMTLRVPGGMLLAIAVAMAGAPECRAQCCLTDLFAGCGTCFRKAPAYAVAPVAAPIIAPIAAPTPPVMVPVQQTSYVPETTYRTQMQTVPVTSYKPSCEIDPCTGCPVECMQPVTQYVQRPVNVPVTQYRAVTTTRYVQMQPGYAAPAGQMAPVAYPAPPAAAISAPAAPAASPFAATIQTTPQAWGAAGSDVPQQLIPTQPGMAAPALPPTGYQFQQPSYQQPTYQQPTYQQPITPQAGVSMPSAPQVSPLQPTAPPALAPAPSLRPIPELPRTGDATSDPSRAANGAPFANGPTPGNGGIAPHGQPPLPSHGTSGNGLNGALPASPAAPGGNGNGAYVPLGSPATGGAAAGPNGMPTVPGTGPTSATGAFPRLLAPTGHTTSWQPSVQPPVAPARGSYAPGYPTAVLPIRLTQ